MNNKSNKPADKDLTLEDIIQQEGYYDEWGLWNNITQIEGKIYRGRVEVLVIDQEYNIFMQIIKDDKYRVPGGSFEKDSSHTQQALAEVMEEAKLICKDITYSGINYIKEFERKIEPENGEIRWNGTYNEVYVAEYDKPYIGAVHPKNKDREMYKMGKWYPISDIWNILKKEHKDALKNYRPDHTVESSIVSKTEYKSKGKKYLNAFKEIELTANNIKWWKNQEGFKFLSNIKDNSKGYFYVDYAKTFVATIAVEEQSDSTTWIQLLEISKDYQGYGLSRQLLDTACKELKANRLSVNKNNSIAIKLYESYGFTKYKTVDDMIFMKYEKELLHLKDNNLYIQTESLQNLDDLRWEDNYEKGQDDSIPMDWFYKLSELYHKYTNQPSEELRIEILNLGWNPEIPVTMENIKKKMDLENNKKSNVDIIDLHENYIFSKKDSVYNLDKWEKGNNNILLITGLSGSGKSSLSRTLSDEYDCDLIELDVLQCYENCSKVLKNDITVKFISEFLNINKDIDIFDFSDIRQDSFKSVFDRFFPWLLNKLSSDKNKKYIIEGVHILLFTKYSDVKKYSLICINTPVYKSAIRRWKRDQFSFKDLMSQGYILRDLQLQSSWEKKYQDFYSSMVTESSDDPTDLKPTAEYAQKMINKSHEMGRIPFIKCKDIEWDDGSLVFAQYIANSDNDKNEVREFIDYINDLTSRTIYRGYIYHKYVKDSGILKISNYDLSNIPDSMKQSLGITESGAVEEDVPVSFLSKATKPAKDQKAHLKYVKNKMHSNKTNGATDQHELPKYNQLGEETKVEESSFAHKLYLPIKQSKYNKKNGIKIHNMADLIKNNGNDGTLYLVKTAKDIDTVHYLRKDTNTAKRTILKIKERIILCKKYGNTDKTKNYYKNIKEKYIDQNITEKDCDKTLEFIDKINETAKQRIKELKGDTGIQTLKEFSSINKTSLAPSIIQALSDINSNMDIMKKRIENKLYLSDYNRLSLTHTNMELYKEQNEDLKSYYESMPSNTKGFMYIDGNDYVGSISVNTDTNIIDSIIINSKYISHGLFQQLIDTALLDLNADGIYVSIENKTIYEICKRCGFETDHSVGNNVIKMVQTKFKSGKGSNSNKKPIYIMTSYRPGSKISDIITSFTKSDVSHASISFDYKLNELYSFGGRGNNPLLDNGFQKESIKDYKSGNYMIRVCCVFVNRRKYDLIKNLVSHIYSSKEFKSSTKYNFAGLLQYIRTTEKSINPTKMVCSQFVAYMFSLADIDLMKGKKSINLVTPDDLTRLSDTDYRVYKLYEGRAINYELKYINQRLKNIQPKAYIVNESVSEVGITTANNIHPVYIHESYTNNTKTDVIVSLDSTLSGYDFNANNRDISIDKKDITNGYLESYCMFVVDQDFKQLTDIMENGILKDSIDGLKEIMNERKETNILFYENFISYILHESWGDYTSFTDIPLTYKVYSGDIENYNSDKIEDMIKHLKVKGIMEGKDITELCI